ncbi:PAS modulated sigma54 specific transcriptional regulator, Fis family [Thermoanaerobacter italicus Ab9]|uniref:HTH-type transcriptional regulatory protein TyrR n=2 Tax=Thermoanaerobacter TaxID=1754 RepID=D3T3N4_THEIA|nr:MULTISPECIES: sigma-54-dependent Fis family transcriptional regulator [Thermoanaerobacter]ADD02836.1 PAS modulated sigma54 specific transcriptional regulator, Fis family [Thermoanaerobacter italicus Ab9]MDP9750883.1 PAS domain S-box-containing protein [Thermoanaerobacter pentosaceus]
MKEKITRFINRKIILIEEKELDKNIKVDFKKYNYIITLNNKNNDHLPKRIIPILENGEIAEDQAIMSFSIIKENENIDFENYNGEVFLVIGNYNEIKGVVGYREIIFFLLENLKSLKAEFDLVKTDLDAFMACSDDLACITDGSGLKVRISSSAEKIYGLKPENLIGKNVNDLEKNGMYFPSATKIAIEEKKKVTVIQKTKTGRKLLVTATPFFDKDNNIKRIVSISKDITDEEKLKAELKQTKELLQKYEEELSSLRIAHLRNSELIYRSKQMEKLIELVNKVAPTESTILIYGETGVGKEVLSKYIHNISRINGPFIKINCGAIPENLLEAELFGYEKGAFTGAKSEGKPGLIEIADKGTLLLDEISELPLSLQVKLLRVLQEKEFIRVGGIKSIKVDVRIIAASNKDLKELVKEGKFRQDLYYRLNVVPVTIPPLRERTQDIPVLAYHFLNIYNEKYGRSKQLTNEVMEVFMKYPWPGNVRELENVIERIVIISENDQITKKDLPGELLNQEESNHLPGVYVSRLMPLKEASALVEYQLIKQAIEECGSSYKAAEVLGVDQSTIIRKLKKYESMQL